MRLAGDDERTLLADFLSRGDERSFRTLYRAHTPVLYLLARRLLGGSHQAAEDAVQEAWIRASRKLDTFRWESSLRTWLSGIVIRCCREAIRRRRIAAAHQSNAMDPELTAAAFDAQRRPEAIDLERAVARLPDGYREVLVLHDIEGYTHKEIAAQLDVDEGTSRSQLFKARRGLRALLRSEPDAS
jgi:RNA polymerase sigma-70 factor (ECF subfamily)